MPAFLSFSPACKNQLSRRQNAKDERERAVISSKSPTTAKIVYHVSLNPTRANLDSANLSLPLARCFFLAGEDKLGLASAGSFWLTPHLGPRWPYVRPRAL